MLYIDISILLEGKRQEARDKRQEREGEREAAIVRCNVGSYIVALYAMIMHVCND